MLLKVRRWLWETEFQVYGFRLPVAVVFGCILFIVGIQVVLGNLNKGSWETLNNDELGYKINYPADWSAEIFPAGYENRHRGLIYGVRAFFNHEFFMPFNKKYMALYWLPMEEPDLMEALHWGNTTIEQDRKGGIQRDNVGIGQYPAIIRIYPTGSGVKKVVYIQDTDGIFVLEFWAKSYNEKVEAVFDRMLKTFETFN